MISAFYAHKFTIFSSDMKMPYLPAQRACKPTSVGGICTAREKTVTLWPDSMSLGCPHMGLRSYPLNLIRVIPA